MSGETKAAQKLRSFLERIERLQEERQTIADDIADVFKELVSDGYDKDAAKVVLKIRANADALAQWQGKTETVDVYLAALGMLPDRAGARVHGNIEEFPSVVAISRSGEHRFPAETDHDPETGEIKDQPETATKSAMLTQPVGTHGPGSVEHLVNEYAGTSSDENPAPHSISQEQPHAQAKAEAAPLNASATIPDEDVPAFLLKAAKPLKPHCLEPSNCAGYGSHTCHRCKKAMAETGVAA